MVEPTHLKHMVVNLDHFPKDRGENSKNDWNHHLVDETKLWGHDVLPSKYLVYITHKSWWIQRHLLQRSATHPIPKIVSAWGLFQRLLLCWFWGVLSEDQEESFCCIQEASDTSLITMSDWVLCDWITVDNQFGSVNENKNDVSIQYQRYNIIKQKHKSTFRT